jgi:hypothetical protein
MAYHTLPTRGLVFASTPTSSTSTRQAPSEDLMLSPDAPINQGLIEYEGWLENAISTLRGPFRISKGPQFQAQNNLIEEITLAITEVQATKREEWSHQLAGMHAQVPLPPSVIDNQCVIVDGG